MAVSKTPLEIGNFEQIRAEIRADLEKFEALLQELREKYTQNEGEGLMEEAARLFTRALEVFQIRGYLSEFEAQRYKHLAAQVLRSLK